MHINNIILSAVLIRLWSAVRTAFMEKYVDAMTPLPTIPANK
jgi:hypothetical protein